MEVVRTGFGMFVLPFGPGTFSLRFRFWHLGLVCLRASPLFEYQLQDVFCHTYSVAFYWFLRHVQVGVVFEGPLPSWFKFGHHNQSRVFVLGAFM